MNGGNVGTWGWDDGNTIWRKIHVDAAGDLQVDVLAAPAFVTHCYGWTGATWTELLVESLANANLRTRLYDGVNPIVSVGTAADIADTNRGLLTQAGVRGWDGAFWKSVNVEDDAGDALANARASLSTVSKLYGYNGATWDRLRVMTPADAFATPTFALQVSSFLMGYDGGDWNMVRVDAAGHLQVDVLSSALPALAATAANQVLINANLATLVTEQGRCYGYDGANWQTLLTDDATYYNLRVRLFEGANGLHSDLCVATGLDIRAKRGLYTRSQILLAVSSTESTQWRSAYYCTDAFAGAQLAAIALWGYNGSTWDRLRTYPTGILKVGRAEVGLLTVRMIGTGQVGAAGARYLYWITMNPSAGASVMELADASAGGGAVVYDHYHTNREAHHVVLDPPMEYTNGIYLETFTNFTSIIFGYL